jgi:hypothetical protein
MSTKIRGGIGAALLAGLFVAGLPARGNAAEACSNATLRGSYAFRVDGLNVSNPYLPLGPFAAVGKNTYDGNGHMTGTIVISANGSVIPTTYTGTYTVNGDCTGFKSAALAIGATVQFDFVVAGNAREIQMIVTRAGPPSALVDGLAVTGAARKIVTGDQAKR